MTKDIALFFHGSKIMSPQFYEFVDFASSVSYCNTRMASRNPFCDDMWRKLEIIDPTHPK